MVMLHSLYLITNTVKGSGGAVLYVESESLIQLENTNFTNNNATDGGGIYIDGHIPSCRQICAFSGRILEKELEGPL